MMRLCVAQLCFTRCRSKDSERRDCLLSLPKPVGTGWDGGWKMRTAKHRDIILLFFSYMKLAVAAP